MNETLGAYTPKILGSKSLGEGDRRYVEEVLKRVLDEMNDTASTGEMYEPFAKIVNFVLANRKIREEVTNVPFT